jgi:outer membrane protein OmpA-like peptidoglycan-associated protein
MNEYKPDLSLARSNIYEACYTYSTVNTIIDDGNPYLITPLDLANVTHKENLSENNKQRFANSYMEQYYQTVEEEAVAKTAEKDTLKAISLAVDSISECEGDKTIVLVDNGISTTGAMAFDNFNVDVENTVAELDSSILPNMTGYTVVWYNMGNATGNQSQLSTEDLNTLKTVWQEVLLKAGADDVTIKSTVSSNYELNSGDLPTVSAVAVNGTSSILNYDDVKAELSDRTAESLTAGISFNGDNIQFVADSYELLDYEATTEVLEPVIKYMQSNPEAELVVIGTTATVGTQASAVTFSEGRAETIATLLNGNGVPLDNITTIGLGYENKFHIDDLEEDGTLNPSNAQKNRAVLIFSKDSSQIAEYV